MVRPSLDLLEQFGRIAALQFADLLVIPAEGHHHAVGQAIGGHDFGWRSVIFRFYLGNHWVFFAEQGVEYLWPKMLFFSVLHILSPMNPYESPIIVAELAEKPYQPPRRKKKRKAKVSRFWMMVLAIGLACFGYGFYLFQFVDRPPSLLFFFAGLVAVVFSTIFLIDP